jgi:membrane-associated phospholipid phosphatase
MAKTDYYKVLGVESKASAAEIKQAYLKLTKLFHPDRYPGDEIILLRFQEITEAYRILGNLDSRLQYSNMLKSRMDIMKENPKQNFFKKKRIFDYMNFFNSTKKAIRNNYLFIIPYLLFLIAGGIYLSLYSKASFSLWLNGNHTNFLDYYFRYATWIGDGIFVILISVIFIAFLPRLSIVLGFAYISSGILSQVLKRIFDTPRPKVIFGALSTIYFVPGIDILTAHSFPSGHTATAFSAFLILSHYTKNQYAKVAFFLIALSVAISRIYLLQHFLVDIYFGSIIGVISSLVCIYAVDNWRNLNQKWWLDYSFFESFRLKLKNKA